jgi:deoxyribonucleoside regulator
MYYLDGLGQSEIANIVGVSRSTVSRLLTHARERGIVRISVDEHDPRDREAEAALVERFGLRRAVVIREMGTTVPANVRREVGYFAAPVVAEVIRGKPLVGLAGGRTLCELVHAIEPGQRGGHPTFVQLMGSIGSSPDRIDGSELCRALARRFDGTFQVLNSPAFAQDQRARDLFLSHGEIQAVWTMFGRLDLALVGVGSLEESAFYQRNVLKPEDLEEARAAGAVGEICGRFFDARGRECDTSLRHRAISIGLEEVRACPEVMVVVSGAGRAQALHAAVAGSLVTSIVSDQAAACSLLALA